MNELDLANKVAVVTGSARGVGRAVAVALAERGARVVVHYRVSRKAAEQTLSLARKHSRDSFMVRADLTKKNQVERVFGSIFKKAGRVDILINTVGNFVYQPIDEVSFEKFSDVIESNLYATFLCSQSVLPRMRRIKSGAIINFGSVGSERLLVRKRTTPYYIAKTGVYLLTKVMAERYGKDGVRINMVSPGVLPTSIVKPVTLKKSQRIEFEDVVEVIYFLLSKEARHIMGANIEVAAGWTPEIGR